ncbi:SBBP repeat-containing protein, partial [Candidatus Uhrbacteria bacterium]|nr:SBBP repeat-containing protein [Candidatus Uhrbacteria bacterium]
DLTLSSPFQSVLNGKSDLFVTKITALGDTRRYATFLGGSGSEFGPPGRGIAIDSSGNVFITGSTNSIDFPVVSAFQSAYGGGIMDAIVAKINSTGSALVYATYLGGSDFDEGAALAIDTGGAAYAAGNTASSNFPLVNALDNTRNGLDGFLTKLDATGASAVYSTFLGGSSIDSAYGLAVDTSGNAYVVGNTDSANFPTVVGSYQTALGGADDAFATKVNSSGSALVYSTYLGGSGSEEAMAIELDDSGNAYVAGNTTSTNFPVVSALQGSFAGDRDIFFTKINAAGSGLVFSTYLGGSARDEVRATDVDSGGNVYLVGSSDSTNFPTVNPIQGVQGGAIDAIVTKLNAAGNTLIYSTYIGGSSTDFATGVAVGITDAVLVSGATFSPDFPVTSGVLGATPSGDAEAFLLRINRVDSAVAAVGQTATASTAPTTTGSAGVTATLTNNTVGSGDARVTTETYASNPGTTNVIDIGAGYVDIKVSGVDAADTVTAKIYYSSLVGPIQELTLQLLYFTGSTWAPVLSSGGATPVKNTTNNLDGTLSGGRFTVVFDSTSTPTLLQLTGTVFALSPGVIPTRLDIRDRRQISEYLQYCPACDSLNHGQQSSILQKIDAAVAAFDRQSLKTSRNILQALTNQLEAWKGNGTVRAQALDPLLEGIADFIAML